MILNPKLVSTVQYVLKEQANNLLFQKKMIQFPVGPQKSPEKIIQTFQANSKQNQPLGLDSR